MINSKFEKHELIINNSGNYWEVKHFNYSNLYRVRFTIVDGVTLVTGDYGNWVFSREFYPKAGEQVSVGYWVEKLMCNSTQTAYVFDEEDLTTNFTEWVNDLIDMYDNSDNEERVNLLETYKNDCIYAIWLGGNGLYYLNEAHLNKPSFIDHEDIPGLNKLNPQLEYIFLAFNEICNRLVKLK